MQRNFKARGRAEKVKTFMRRATAMASDLHQVAPPPPPPGGASPA